MLGPYARKCTALNAVPRFPALLASPTVSSSLPIFCLGYVSYIADCAGWPQHLPLESLIHRETGERSDTRLDLSRP
jgi:hypothetical protein